MPRRPRVTLLHLPLHVIQRGNNRQACFVADEDYGFYLDWLKEYASKTGCAIHAYVLMTNHVHLLLSSASGDGVSALMKVLGIRSCSMMNWSRGWWMRSARRRTGTSPWEIPVLATRSR